MRPRLALFALIGSLCAPNLGAGRAAPSPAPPAARDLGARIAALEAPPVALEDENAALCRRLDDHEVARARPRRPLAGVHVEAHLGPAE